jgi:hypothetical protein
MAEHQCLRDDGLSALGCREIAHDVSLSQIDADDVMACSHER